MAAMIPIRLRSGNNSAEERTEGALSFSAAFGVFVVQAEPDGVAAFAVKVEEVIPAVREGRVGKVAA
jgi:hypothetical protein